MHRLFVSDHLRRYFYKETPKIVSTEDGQHGWPCSQYARSLLMNRGTAPDSEAIAVCWCLSWLYFYIILYGSIALVEPKCFIRTVK